jgi:cell division transport system permease protein
MFTKLGRITRFAFQNFWRNIWLSTVTVSIIILSFLSVNFFILGNYFLDAALGSIEDRVNISVYFKQSTPEPDILKFVDELKTDPRVKSVAYVSRDMALQELKERDDITGNGLIRDSLDELGSNPLSAKTVVKATSVEQYPALLALIDTAYEPIIEKRSFDDRELLIKRIQQWKVTLRQVGTFINIFFALIAALIVYNTIRITIYTRRKEIGVMKLVGATNWFIRAPLLLESAIYSVIAIAVTVLIFYPLLGVVQPYANAYFDGQALDVLGFYSKNFWQIVGYELLASVALNIFSSSVAIGRYLKV